MDSKISTEISQEIKIREIEEDDGKAMIELRKKLAVETKFMLLELNEVNEDIEKEILRIKNTKRDKCTKVFVAEVDGNIVGFIGMKFENFKRIKHVAEFAMGIQKEYWGKGIAHLFLSKLNEWSIDNNIKRICVDVVKDNKRAINAYKKHGFEIEGIKIKDHYIGKGTYLDIVIMTKLLF